jgi:hypothetical protein
MKGANMTKTEKDVREYLDKFMTKEQIKEEQATTLTFSYLLGLPVEECRGMYAESEMSRDELDQIDDIEGIIWRIKRELEN